MWSLRLVSTVAPSQRVFLALPRAVVLNGTLFDSDTCVTSKLIVVASARPNQFAATKLISVSGRLLSHGWNHSILCIVVLICSSFLDGVINNGCNPTTVQN
jgi:hypothetical protein